MDMIKTLAAELQQNEQYVANVVKLLDEGNTVPFIARYRKEMHGTMDDQTIRVLAERLAYLRGLETRKAEIRDAIDAQGKLTPELTAAIENAATLSALDDIYRPYRPKRRTRASMAREKGLEPLADAILSARNASPSLEALAQPYVSEEKGVSGTDAALAGASDIIAENLSDDATLRGRLRDIIQKTGIIRSASDNADDTTYTMYHDFSEPVRRMQSHRVLALDRGEKEGVLKVTLECDEQAALSAITRAVLHPRNPFGAFLRDTAADSWKRLLFPSLERETRNELTDKAFEQCAGFLRVPESDNLLDRTGVHPESYKAAETLLTLCGYTAKDAADGKIGELAARVHQLGEKNAAERCGIGVPTLDDMVKELSKPGRDPRDELPPPMLRSDVLDLTDLKPGMKLKGTVRNVADFGAFIDIGVHQDGLVHISQLCNRFVKHPSEVVTVGDVVDVTVLSVDPKSKRISLSMKH